MCWYISDAEEDDTDGDDAGKDDDNDGDDDAGKDDGSDDDGGGVVGMMVIGNTQVFLGCSDLSTSTSLPHAWTVSPILLPQLSPPGW